MAIQEEIRLLFHRRVSSPEKALLDAEGMTVAEEKSMTAQADQSGQGCITPVVTVAADPCDGKRGEVKFKLLPIQVMVPQVENIVRLFPFYGRFHI